MALDGFSAQDKVKITNAVRQLGDPGKAETIRSKTAKLPISEPMYIMRAAPSIRLIYRTTPNGIEILDVVQKDTLRTLLNNNVETAVTAKSASAKSATRPFKATPAKSKLKNAAGRTYSTKSKKTLR